MTATTTEFEAVRLTIDDGVATLLLNRPESLNSLNSALFRDLPLAVTAAAEAGARALLVTGAGRGFCSGADLVSGQFTGPVSDEAREQANRASFEKVVTLVRALNEAPMPVVTAINGVAAGGGVGIALAGDVILMAQSARFVLTFVPRLGLVPDVAVTWLMSRLAGRARAMGASLLGDAISSADAERWGLVYRVLDDAALMTEAQATCRKLADGPQRAVLGTRQLVDAAPRMPLAEHILFERDLQARLIGGPDFMEGVAAFRAKRPVNFRKA